jgi:acyl-CoA thioester hydrolase
MSSTIDLTQRALYPYWSHDMARWGDTDRIGHVNNAVFATFFETGRVSLLHDPALTLAPPGQLFVIARLAIDFRAEMHWPGDVEIGTGLLRLGRSSMVLAQALFQDGRCTATAESTLVLIEESTRRSVALPPESRAALLGFALQASGPDAAPDDDPANHVRGAAG